jgi:glycine betaine/proline transport system permease protein
MEKVIPLADWVNSVIDFLLDIFGGFLRALSEFLMNTMDGTVDVLEWIPAPIIMIAIALVVWKWARWRYALFALASLGLMYGLGLWVRTLDTIVMVLVSTFLAIIVAIPLGVLAFWNDRFERIQRVFLDFMQTTPAFVYLVPAVMFFGMGETAAIFATIIFAAPPPIRFINLGLREVPEELVEAGNAFGATRMQLLRKIQVPAAMPTIMGGINQCIMLSLSMVVIASMIGAGGLGGEVLRAIQTVNVGGAFEAGLAVVLLAIIFDRTVSKIRRGNVRQANK